MKPYFTKEQIAEIYAKAQTIEPKTNRLLLKYVGHTYSEAKAKEYAHHGFARRIQTLARCIENVFRLVPPDTFEVPPKQVLYDAQINIQGAIGNTYGCVDNLAWVWAHERRLVIDRREVGLRKHNRKVRDMLSGEFRSYLETLDPWLEYLVDYRDALAHRIPLYIPPGGVLPGNRDKAQELENQKTSALNSFQPYEYNRLHAEQEKLFVFQPIICHSYVEMTAPYVFHAQLIADFLTVEQLGQKMLAELLLLS